MAPHPLQPSEYEIQLEVEALKDLRRRSTNPGALTIDPDLPNQSSSVSPTSPYRPNRAFTLPGESVANDNRSGSTSNTVSESSRGNDTLDIPTDDPSHLFWVPASLHPEIAPAEFRAFLKEHARAPPADDNATFSRSPSLLSSSSLNRKKSMLSRQYKPKDTDGDEEENIVPIRRSRSIYHQEGPQLTINDLQVLEELAEVASQSDDPSKLRNVLRRSLSLNVSPTAILLDEIIDMDDDADAPIVIPTRDKALKRTARTKIRKAGLPGDGGGHRFAASRRGKKVSQTVAEPRTSSDLSTSDHGDAESTSVVRRRTTRSEEGSTRPDSSYSEEQSIFDAYATQEDEEPAFSPPQPLEPFTVAVNPTPKPIIEESLPPVEPEPPAPVLHHPQPQRLTVPQPFPGQGLPSRTPSPEPFSQPASVSAHPAASSPFVLTTSPPPTSKKEKDKKGLFKWGDKSSKKAQKEKEKDRNSEKEPGFLFSLFSRKKQDSEYQSSIAGGTSGREAAQALLGASKSKSHASPASPGLAPGIGGNPYARYPLHVERAIYRLSHIKLANPRRPLYEQVLISNLMFWYLGIINKAQNPTLSQDGTNENTQSTDKQEAEKEEREVQQREKEQREKAEKEHLAMGRLEKERLEKESRERELEMKKRESGKRGPLTKSPPGTPTGGRRAEMPVKGPQYGMQHRVMEQEYGNYSMQQPPLSPTTPANGGSPGRRPPQPVAGQSTPIPNQHMVGQPVHIGPVPPIRQMANRLFNPMEPVPSQPASYYGPDNHRPQQRPGLPPGAMPPMDKQGWMSHTNSSTPSLRRTPSPQGRSHSPPIINQQFRKQNISQERLGDQNGNYRTPMRSLSVTASPGPPQPNGAGHSTSPGGYPKRPRTADSPASEEEDVPLAVWQQQRRR